MRKKKNDDKMFRVSVGAEPADRPIAPLRGDLKVSPQLFYGQLCFVIKDPVTLRYFRLQPVEHFLIEQMDGRRTARDLLGLLQQQFPEASLSVGEVLRFIGMLHESHLLVGEGAAHAAWLSTRAGASRRKRWLEKGQNFLFMKIPLFHPDATLNFLEATLGRVLFRPVTGIIALCLIFLALLQVLADTDKLFNTPYSLFSLQNLAILYCVFVGTKVLHEFGHGLAAKHFGAEVPQMGVMLFVFTPSFYCDTSDAWMIPSRAARLWINSAGIVVELVLAALATFIWAYTPADVLLNQIALNVMISCSVATLFFNANPLLRYDGYYFLADALEIPNLMTKGTDFLKYYAQKYLLGLKPHMPPDRKRLGWLTAFAVLSGGYRYVVMIGIVTLLYYFFDNHGMAPVGVLLAAAYVFAAIMVPVVKGMNFLWHQRWDLSRRLAYTIGAAVAGGGALTAVAFMPWNTTLREPLVVLAERDEPVFVQTPGYVDQVLVDVARPVKKGDVIVRLRSPERQAALAKVRAQYEQELNEAETAQAQGKPAAMKTAMSRADIYLHLGVEQIEKEIRDLEIRAPIDGIVVRDTSLTRIAGNYVAPGTRLCRVITARRLQARMSLPQAQAAMVKDGMPVKIRLWSNADEPIAAEVTRVSSQITDRLTHPALGVSNSGEVALTNQVDKEGASRTLGKRSTVIIELPGEHADFLADGMTGRAEIMVQRTTVLGRVWRMVLENTIADWHL